VTAPRSPSPLQALIALAASLAAASDLDAAMPDALRHASAAIGAESCAVWTMDGEHVVCRWGTRVDGDLEAVRALVAGDAPAAALGPTVVPLRASGITFGALVVHAPSGVDGEGLPPSAVADVLAPTLAHVDRSARDARFIERVVDSLPMGLYVIDRDYRIQLWNRKRETDTHGVARDDALGRSIFEVLTRQDAALLRSEFDDVLTSGNLRQFQMESRSTGELRTYRLTKIPMRIDGGEVSHVITVGEDITEWKAALERTAQSEKLAAIGQLAAGVMHEVNNPLATIAACAETMTLAISELPSSRPAPPGFGEYLRIIDHEVHRCRGIVDGLLNFSRAKPLQRVRLGLNGVVEQTLFLLKHHTRFKRYAVRLELAGDGGPAFTGDADQLTQVLMALLLNAADAIGSVDAEAEDAPAITIRTLMAGDDAIVEVSDEGLGIPRDELTKIFEPFYTTKEPGAGTGLGLAICYGIIRDHGGRIEVESTLGAGSTFRVLLPAA
jgi:two-component system NtrC family sensor kinase